MSYHIADEPYETSLAAYVVRPTAPLLAVMMAGAWLSWPWFAFNAIALGSPTKTRELGLVAGAFVGTAVLAATLIALVRGGVVTDSLTIRLALTAIVAFKLTMTYWMAVLQNRTFHVYQYYGGIVRTAGAVLTLGYLARNLVIGMSDDPLWIIIVAGAL